MKKVTGYGSEKDSNNVKVKKSEINNAGFGLFAKTDFKKGDYVCMYSGLLVSNHVVKKMSEERGAYVMATDYEDNNGDVKHTNIDSYNPESCYGRYANDILDNTRYNIEINSGVFIEIDKRHGGLEITATKAIKKGAELYLKYGVQYWCSRDRIRHLPKETIERMKLQSKKFATWYLNNVTMVDDAETVTDHEYDDLHIAVGDEIDYDGLKRFVNRWEQLDPTADIAIVAINRNNPEQNIDLVRNREIIDLTGDDNIPAIKQARKKTTNKSRKKNVLTLKRSKKGLKK